MFPNTGPTLARSFAIQIANPSPNSPVPPSILNSISICQFGMDKGMRDHSQPVWDALSCVRRMCLLVFYGSLSPLMKGPFVGSETDYDGIGSKVPPAPLAYRAVASIRAESVPKQSVDSSPSVLEITVDIWRNYGVCSEW